MGAGARISVLTAVEVLIVGGVALVIAVGGCATSPGAHARWHTGWDRSGMTGEEFERDVRDCDREANRVAAMCWCGAIHAAGFCENVAAWATLTIPRTVAYVARAGQTGSW